MPNPKVCNRIADPAARRRCLNYQGEFAQDLNQPATPGAMPGARPMPGAGIGRPARGRGRRGGGRFGGGGY